MAPRPAPTIQHASTQTDVEPNEEFTAYEAYCNEGDEVIRSRIKEEKHRSLIHKWMILEYQRKIADEKKRISAQNRTQENKPEIPKDRALMTRNQVQRLCKKRRIELKLAAKVEAYKSMQM